MTRGKDKGFSLIETLVAMTVLSVSPAVLLSAVEEHTRSIAAVADRATARWIAENQLVELRLGMEGSAGTARVSGRDWWIKTQASNTADPDLIRVDISVGPLPDRDAPLARLTGFVDKAAGDA